MKQLEGSYPQTEISVIGDNVMQNDLLSSFVEKHTGLRCSQLPSIDLADPDQDALREGKVLLIDSRGRDFYHLWDNIDPTSDLNSSGCFLTIFNLDPDPEIGLEAVEKGIQGVFYCSEPIETIPKGIRAILDGELWFSRRTMSRYLMSKIDTQERAPDLEVPLTKREKEIFAKLYVGQSNTEIADHFSISYNTVKTHVFRIYRKINAGNRFQATLWAARHLNA